jgi:hypothetical protein
VWDSGTTKRYALDNLSETDEYAAMRWRQKAALAAATVLTAFVAAAGAAAGHPAAILCGPGYYKNVSGHCVHRPAGAPAGATARCYDGTYSYSQHASGTCSHHGGVARWIQHP